MGASVAPDPIARQRGYGTSHVRPRDSDSPNVAALFEAANKLRGSVESAEYKHLVFA